MTIEHTIERPRIPGASHLYPNPDLEAIERLLRPLGWTTPTPPSRTAVWISGGSVSGFTPAPGSRLVPSDWVVAWSAVLDEVQRAHAGEPLVLARFELLRAYAELIAAPVDEPVSVTTRCAGRVVSWWIRRIEAGE